MKPKPKCTRCRREVDASHRKNGQVFSRSNRWRTCNLCEECLGLTQLSLIYRVRKPITAKAGG